MADVRDILELERSPTPEVSKEVILGLRKEAPKKKKEKEGMRRPEGMHRELYALLYSDSNKDLPPLLPSDSGQGYKSVKAKLGMKRVRPWKWMPFTNLARKDNAVLYHWRRVCDEGKEYPFAMFNKKVELLSYSDAEYSEHLLCDGWTRIETDTLFELCHRFDLRWPVIHDRWPSHLTTRKMEDLKERYYSVTNILKKVNNLTGPEGKIVNYDADHERRRKQQLLKLWDRTPKQIEEEQQLLCELRKIEARKKEREKKTQDLQKLISADADARKIPKTTKKKIQQTKIAKLDAQPPSLESCTGIKFPDVKSSGVSLRSQRMKLPASVGQKKVKAIEQLLTELNLETNPMAVEEVCQHFNDLRSDLVLMYDLRTILINYVFDLQTLKHQCQSVMPDKVLEIPESLTINPGEESPSRPRAISEMIDAVATPTTPNRKRKAALEQSNVLKKIKART
ncbi:DNA methyltransferase 1-associated protein 1-like [Homarus americanus]|uniref:DNA methyltransferase 1-associated protein 1-like n=1 Tax=Homarus americanus TaxID=6706 RepID=UPI001C45AC1E|nr:DNA methyltransferase 1-associated protein 1-like [Homarus americanus]XP_042203501.1 DNA methyltransferase 1-associated protein 1-like [Homarus americanus]XP_042203502.1 DNA methyltransferase 1-associated protein 1-like [Homarus americanus]